MFEHKTHKMYAEFEQQLKDDLDFANMYDDTEEDFLAWVMDYETDKDWEGEGMGIKSKVEWCVSRLVDNYEWQDAIEYDDWLKIQDALVFAVMGSSNNRIEEFVNTCLEHGVIEGDENEF